jgi:hypothetical protein
MTRFLLSAAAALLATTSLGHADTITGSYSASVAASSSAYAPTVQDVLPTPFSASIGAGTTTSPTTFFQVDPVGGNAWAGTQTGAIDLSMSLLDGGSAITGVSASAGGLGASVSHGTLYFAADYELFYSNQTDCLVWNGSSCTPTGNTSTIGETLTISFADGATAALNLYNWSDWNMSPNVSLSLLNGPQTTPVPEPASVAIFGSALLGLCVTRRRQKAK